MSAPAPSTDGDTLAGYRSVWDRKPVLRVVYDDLFRRIAEACGPGTTLEIGGGSGNLAERLLDVVASDIQYAPWLNLVADAQRLPFAAGALGNIVMLDVLHHVEYPLHILAKAERVLRPGGRIVMVEPAAPPCDAPCRCGPSTTGMMRRPATWKRISSSTAGRVRRVATCRR